MIIVGDQLYLDLETVQGGASVQVGQCPLPTLDRGTWHDFAAEITWHPAAGTISFWHNGTPITFDPVPSPASPGTSFPEVQGAFVPDRRGERQNALQYPNPDPGAGVATVAFQVELTLERFVDRLNDLA